MQFNSDFKINKKPDYLKDVDKKICPHPYYRIRRKPEEFKVFKA